MLVDPMTGEPIGPSPGQPASFAGAMGMGAMDAAGFENSTAMGMLQHYPTLASATGWNAMRGSNTILRGGFSGTFMGARFRDAKTRGRMVNHNPFRPRSWSRLSAVENMAHDASYSPMWAMSKMGNWAGRKAAASGAKSGADWYQKATRAGLMGQGVGDDDYFTRGTIARLSASRKVDQLIGSKKASADKKIARALENVSKLDPKLGTVMGQMGGPAAFTDDAGRMVAASVQGTMSQAITGYMSGVTRGPMTAGARQALQAADKNVFLRFQDTATRHLKGADFAINAQNRLTHKGAQIGGFRALGRAATAGQGKAAGAIALRGLGLAIPGVNIAMTAMLAMDLTRMGVQAGLGVANFGLDAMKSMRGSIQKPAFGMGYQDNMVAATSRQRGVGAIQASRLNARSVLGAEGAMLSGYYG